MAPFILQPPHRDGGDSEQITSHQLQGYSVMQPSVQGDNDGGYSGGSVVPEQVEGQQQAFGSVDHGPGGDGGDGRSSLGWQEQREERVRRRHERRMQ
eukprot:1159846-Pelagomonas_calceolata.AAC.27